LFFAIILYFDYEISYAYIVEEDDGALIELNDVTPVHYCNFNPSRAFDTVAVLYWG